MEGSNKITVADKVRYLGWQIGDRIALAPTGMPEPVQLSSTYVLPS